MCLVNLLNDPGIDVTEFVLLEEIILKIFLESEAVFAFVNNSDAA